VFSPYKRDFGLERSRIFYFFLVEKSILLSVQKGEGIFALSLVTISQQPLNIGFTYITVYMR
jgi:hypothetical protein